MRQSAAAAEPAHCTNGNALHSLELARVKVVTSPNLSHCWPLECTLELSFSGGRIFTFIWEGRGRIDVKTASLSLAHSNLGQNNNLKINLTISTSIQWVIIKNQSSKLTLNIINCNKIYLNEFSSLLNNNSKC